MTLKLTDARTMRMLFPYVNKNVNTIHTVEMNKRSQRNGNTKVAPPKTRNKIK